MIQDSSITLSGLLSSDEMKDVISHELVGFLVCLFSRSIPYFVYDLIINNNNNITNGLGLTGVLPTFLLNTLERTVLAICK